MRHLKKGLLLVAMIALFIVLGACGQKDAADIIRDLEKKLESMESYQTTGTMIINTGEQPLEYDLEVWYKDPHFYRIALTNQQKDVTQVVLRNDDGVFVLTPNLNKSFRFQSNWPNEQGQVYLYQTIIQSILNDEARQMAEDEDRTSYVFDVRANYQNSTMTRQRIWLNQDQYEPTKVEIANDQAQVLVVVDFEKFQLNVPFDEDAFDMDRNMTTMQLQSVPVGSDDEDSSEQNNQDRKANPESESDTKSDQQQETDTDAGTLPADAADAAEEVGTDAETDAELQELVEIGIMEPGYIPEGVMQQGIRDIEWNGETASVIHYTGDYQYTILETRPTSMDVTASWGKPIVLDHTVGVLLGEEQKTLRWIADGIEFRLTSANLPEDEMVKVANSVFGQSAK